MYDIKITHDKKKGWILLEKLDCDFDKLISQRLECGAPYSEYESVALIIKFLRAV